MRTSLTSGGEMDIFLSLIEITDLGRKALSGSVQLRGLNARRLEILVDVALKDEYLRLEQFPSGACFEEITAYQIKLSGDSYEELKRRGTIGERFDGIGRVTLYDEEKCKLL